MKKMIAILLLTIVQSGFTQTLPPAVTLDTSNWLPFPLSSYAEMQGTALDMSWLLEAPAGQHGFLTVQDDKFVFADGTPARFWGGNIFGEANFPDKNEAHYLADIIARSGANIIRMHHLDVVKPWTDKVVQRSFFGGQMPETTREIDKEMLDKFFYMFYCLKQRGIYIFLSHLSSRWIMQGDDFPGDAEGFSDIHQGFKVEGMFDPYLIDLQQEYLQAILTAVNPYTGLAMIDDPALVLTEIINENSLFWLQPNGGFAINSGFYKNMLQSLFAEWLEAKYGDQESLVIRWSQKDKIALYDNESLMEATIAIPHIYKTDADWPVSEQRKRDTYKFLYDLQDNYYQQMYSFLRKIGLKIPIAGSNHWCSNAADLHVNARLDYVDRHDYWTHPKNEYNYIAGQGVQPEPMVKNPIGGNIGGLARRRVFGKPYTISEWHNPLPNPYRAEGTPLIAAYSCLHGWHPMHYAYWGAREAEPDTINSFEVIFDPTQMNLIPVSALLFHRQDFQHDNNGYFKVLTPSQVMHPVSKVEHHPEVSLIGTYGLAFTDMPNGPQCNNSTLLKAALEADGVYTSVTQEISWNTREGLVVLNSPRTQGVIGFFSDRTLQTSAMTFEMKTEFGVILASSLTNKPLIASERILISTSGDARFSDIRMAEDFSIIEQTGHFPFVMQPIEGTVIFKTNNPVKVYALSPGGRRIDSLETAVTPEGYSFDLKASNTAMHYEILRE
ncbi:hypothetical protein EH223_10795 [candidate division KSB1 bacterium]|nr:hypothetical protein [candidate division KSB1 bacterium]RQW03108.1 MAG: hypothetical protein EH223_10795 [candidate division KSB1 bacterium]